MTKPPSRPAGATRDFRRREDAPLPARRAGKTDAPPPREAPRPAPRRPQPPPPIQRESVARREIVKTGGGGTLLDALARQYPDASRTTLRQMLQNDRVRVNGELERDAKREVGPDDYVDVAGRETRDRLDPRVGILYEDDFIIVINKAAGLLTVASPGEREATVQAFLNRYLQSIRYGNRIHVVHRLDRDSSGVLVFAKDYDTRQKLKDLFVEHDIDRVYVAIIHGHLKPADGTFRSHLAEDRSLKMKSVNPRHGKEAITHYRTIDSGDDFSMLEVTLETGRKNQIRVHLSEAGHPIVGDILYGEGLENPLGRLGLHAKHLGFVHPETGKKMSFTVPIPDAFRKMKL